MSKRGLGYVSKHGRWWMLDVQLNGKRIRKQLGLVKLLEAREARRVADEFIAQKQAERFSPQQKGNMPFSEFAKKFLVRAMETKRSWAQYVGKSAEQTPLIHAVRFFGETLLRDINTDRVEQFRSYLLKQRCGPRYLKPASANRYLANLKHVFSCAVKWQDADNNPAAGVKPLKEIPLLERVLSEAEQTVLLRALPQWLRQVTVFTLQTALRRGDIVGLTWEAVQGNVLELCETKEGRKRYVPLNATARAVLSMLRVENPKPTGYVFQPDQPRITLEEAIRREWNRAVKNCRIAKIRFHDLRHTTLTRLCQAGVDVCTVQAIAGHSSLRTTQRYLHSSDQAKKAAVEKLDNLGTVPPQGSAFDGEESPASGTIQ